MSNLQIYIVGAILSVSYTVWFYCTGKFLFGTQLIKVKRWGVGYFIILLLLLLISYFFIDYLIRATN